MKLRCRCCRGRLGLGVISVNIYVPEKWWFQTHRFCSRECKHSFLQKKAEDLERAEAIHALYTRPP